MAFTKYASFEVSDILGIKGSHERRTASLDKFADFEDYRTEDGFLYARIRAISSRVNKNHDGWPSVELAGSPEIFDQHTSSEGFVVHANKDARFGFSTFLGKPIFVDHHNSDPTRARGVIVDAKFHVDDHKTSSLDPYYASEDVDPEHLPGSWVELLLEVDAKQFPRLAKAVIEGSSNPHKGIDGWSMGCDVEKSVCSICKNAATAPDEFCNHIKLKGAQFDTYDSMGRKTSRSAYENCYGVKFFEISAVFDPADETALSREVRSSIHKEAENPLPQADMSHAPQEVDTLRQEKICPVCGSTMDNETCDVCSYTEPPDGFQNPDLGKAQDTDHQMDESQEQTPDGEHELEIPGPNSDPQVQNTPRNPGPVSHVTDDMDWDVSIHPKLAGRINDAETPAIPGAPPSTEEPTDLVLSDQTAPVTSRVRTASDFIAAAGRNKENTMSNHKVAAEPIPGADNQSGRTMDHDETRVDVVGVGGVQDASNEEASKADAQVDVEGVGGTGVEGVSAESTENVDQGSEHSKNVESIPTKTWNGTEGQADPVSGQPFPASEDGVKRSGWIIEALDSGPYPPSDESAGGGSAVKGTQPADPVGNAEDRVDVLDATTSPANNSGPTDTWSGTDGNGVTRQQDPVTNETLEGADGVKSSHIFTAFRLADLEIELGLIDPSQKYARAAELEASDPAIVEASLNYAQRVKTAASKKVAKRLPVLGRSSAVSESSSESVSEKKDDLDPDFALGA